MMRFFEKTKGAISIFLALIMLPMFTCAGLIVDGARISAAKTTLSGAGDLAMSAALSEYDTVLQDVYGLFAMSETTEELERNVSRYFTNTINNAGVLEASDSYTRSFINSIGSLFSTDEMSFDNIVDTRVEGEDGFQLVEVTGSALGRPEVLERQIIEFMKYRGPVSMGTGLLTKLGCIGETSKQTKVMEAKVDYEGQLDTVQEACETTYEAITKFNDAIKNGKCEDRKDHLDALQNDVDEAESLIEEMTEYLSAAKSSIYEVKRLKIPVINGVKIVIGDEKFDPEELKDKELDKIIGKELMAEFSAYDEAMKKLYWAYGKGDPNSGKTVCEGSLNQDIDFVKTVQEYRESYQNFLDELGEKMDKLNKEREELESNKEENKEAIKKNKKTYEACKSCALYLYGSVATAAEMPKYWREVAAEKSTTAADLLMAWRNDFVVLGGHLEDSITGIDAILENVDKLKGYRSTWKRSLDNLSESDVKASMQADYENIAQDINRDAVEDLKKVLTDNKTHFEELIKKLDAITYYGKKVCIPSEEAGDPNNRYSSIPQSTGSSDPFETADTCMGRNFKSVDVHTVEPSSYQKIDGKKVDGENDEQQFYRFLKNTCATKGSTSDAEKNNAKSAKANVIKEGNKGTALGDVPEGVVSADLNQLTAAVNAINSITNDTGDAGLADFAGGTISEGGSEKDQGAAAKENVAKAGSIFDSLSSITDNIGNIAEDTRDILYMQEYFTEMFSCYTTGLQPDGAASIEEKTLNGKLLSADNCVFFRSEAEYILWGKDSVQGNLNATRATLFGVRFALNSVFALTNQHTRLPALSAATAIAGWTGFGVPIVQTVILLAWAMAESIVDVEDLCSGEAVPVYKTAKTWKTDPGGLIEKGVEVAEKVIDDVFAKIEEVSVEAIDDIAGYVKTYTEDTVEGVLDSVSSTVMTSIESLATRIIGETNYQLTEEDIRSKFYEMLDTMLAEVKGGTDAISKATEAALSAVKSNDGLCGTIVNKIYGLYEAAKENASAAANGIETMIKGIKEDLLKTITAPINKAVDAASKKLQEKTAQILQEGGAQVKEKVCGAIKEYMSDMSGGSGKGGSTVLASAFSMTYKEYLKMFLMISLLKNEDACLKRCAALIQENVNKQKESGETTLDISKAYTMVASYAEISVRSTFLDMPIVTTIDENGKTRQELDFSNIGSGRQHLRYVGFLGY